MEVSLSQDEVRQLQDRRSMEAKEELRRIDCMGRVDALKYKLDRKLGRNLYQKRQVGPLEKKRRTSLTHSRSLRLKGKVTRVVQDGEMIHRKKKKSSSHKIAAMKREQDAELAAIKEMGIVRSRTDDNSKVKGHLHNHLSRMCNHRLMIKPQGHSDRNKSSVLVTMEERGGDQAMELYHQQSKVMIEGFMQASSHKLRVLEKLSSRQIQNIKKTIRANRHRSYAIPDVGMEVITSSSVQDAGTKNESSPAIPTVQPATPSPATPTPVLSAPPPPVLPAPPPPASLTPHPPPLILRATPPLSAAPHPPPVPPLSPRTSAAQRVTPSPVPALPPLSAAPHPPPVPPLSPRTSAAQRVTPSPVPALPPHPPSLALSHTPSLADEETSIVWRTCSEGNDNIVCEECVGVVSGGGVASDEGGVISDGGGVASDEGGVISDGGSDEGRVVSDEGGVVSDEGGVVSDEGRVVGDGGRVVSDGGRVDSDGGGVVSDEGRVVSDEGGVVSEDEGVAMMSHNHQADMPAVAIVTSDHRDKMSGMASWEVDDVADRQVPMPRLDPAPDHAPSKQTVSGSGLFEDTQPSSCTLTSDSTSSLGSTHNHFGASLASSSSTFSLNDSSPLPYPHHSPQLSLSFSAGDLETHLLQASHHMSTHGYYNSVEVEINPFALEFQAGVSENADSAYPGPPPPPPPLARIGSDIFSPLPTCCADGMARREIPSKAFQDVRFQEYIKTLDHSPPSVQDYITFKMRVIGDLIEETYADKLNQAMDEVFYELVKENLTWNTFKTVSKRLLVQGARIQDGIMLIPCFARQLVDFVPGLGATIEDYTAAVLDNYAADHILGMGGWGSLMASYSEDTGLGSHEDEEVWHGGADVSGPSSAPWNQSPNHMSPGSYMTMPTRKRQASKSSAVDPPLNLPILPRPFPLRRCTSVEVLLDDSSEETTPTMTTPTVTTPSLTFSGPLYSRSASINSLNLATPTTPSGHPFVYMRRTQVTDSSTPMTPVAPGDGWPLPSIHEESRLSSRRSSTCSVIIISNRAHLEEGEGFGVVTTGSKVNMDRLKSSDSASSGEYVDLYSSSSQTGSREGSATPSTKRRRSSVEVIGPIAVATVHAMAAILYVLSS